LNRHICHANPLYCITRLTENPIPPALAQSRPDMSGLDDQESQPGYLAGAEWSAAKPDVSS
jgi:hypothetical protein